ncbi:hypothetical protein [Roseomonas elaeocarpi]|uniref:Uncharacterized protein n=1 Tax=Roseomonas elaeocarpi TaxID=907779 RepID=A0ABV6JWU4_9PROT
MEEPRLVTIELQGRTFTGSYRVEGDLVRVTADPYGSEEDARLDGADPHDVAQGLLLEMIRRKEDL